MNTPKHTPGPWAAYQRQNAQGGNRPQWRIHGPGLTSAIATVDFDLTQATVSSQNANVAANAHLIAAAPAMYEALQDAYEKLCYLAPDKFDDEEHAANWQRDLSTMLAALAQAEGRG